MCTCLTYDVSKCAARAHHLSLQIAQKRYGDCHCSCHENEDGKQISKEQWQKERFALATTSKSQFTVVASVAQEAEHLRQQERSAGQREAASNVSQ